MKTVFYAWQSDLPNRTNRTLIERCIESAIEKANSMRPPEDHLVLDKDTQGVSGFPVISEVILSKIESCAVFVGDLSFVTAASAPRPIPNPNVMLELGYAISSLRDRRIVGVFNTAYGDPYELPFDMRNRRLPLEYRASEEDGAETLAVEREKLTRRLTEALIEAAKHAPDEPDNTSDILPVHAAKPADEYAFAIGSHVARTRSRNDEGRVDEYVYWHDHPSAWLRIVPHVNGGFRRAQLQGLVRNTGIPLQALGGSRATEIVPNEFGVIVLGFDGEEPETTATRITQVFLTGEIWGINRLVIEPKQVQPRSFQIPWPKLAGMMEEGLRHYLQFARETLGLGLPLSVIMGLSNVKDAIFVRDVQWEGGNSGTVRSFEGRISRVATIRESEVDIPSLAKPLYEAIFEACGLDYTQEPTEYRWPRSTGQVSG